MRQVGVAARVSRARVVALAVCAAAILAETWPAAQSRESSSSTRVRVWLGIDPLHADPRSPQALAALEGLREAFSSGGFVTTASAKQADVRIELTGQRVMRRGIALIRTTLSRGDDLIEVRGRSTENTRLWRSAAVEVLRQIEQLLADKHVTPALATFDNAVADATPSPRQSNTPQLLSRLNEFVATYQKSFASIVAEERYSQEYWRRRLPYPSPLQVTRRDLLSELGFTFFPGAGMWFAYRQVLQADGKPVPHTNKELEKLLLARDIPSSEQFKAVTEASARFNIGPATRNFNVPMTTLLFASPEHRERSQFELLRTETHRGTEIAVLAFTETVRPTLITRNGHDRPSRGLMWIQPASGNVVRTDLAISEEMIDARLTTWFTYDEHTRMTVPTRMREVYDFAARQDEYVETLATYANFRRFETTSRIRP